MIKQGDTDLFSIDPKSGVIKTLRGFDYERDHQHILIIDTEENCSELPGATTRVVIKDVNDIPPLFSIIPRPITLNDDVPIGTGILNLTATDSDGTSPGNQVRYEIIGRKMTTKYFTIDPDKGVICVRDDLRKESDSEYQVDVEAYDLGEPALSSVTIVPIFVRHISTVLPDIALGFAEDSYNVEISADAGDNTLIKTLTVNNNHAHDTTPLRCEIYSGNEEGLFDATITEERNCALKLKKGILDYEHSETYLIKIKLESFTGFLKADRNTTMVKVQVLDVNDNTPEFVFPNINLTQSRFFASVPKTIQFSWTVLQIDAYDRDSGKYGKLEYKLLNDGKKNYFSIDSATGIIRTTTSFNNIRKEQLPFRLKVQVKDNPNSTANVNVNEAPVIVNLIDNENLLVMTIQNAVSEGLLKEGEKIAKITQDKTGLLIGIHNIVARKNVTVNGTIETYPLDSDVWFYAVDPVTEMILNRNDTKIKRSLLEQETMDDITAEVSLAVRAKVIDIHAPVMSTEQTLRTQTAVVFSGELFPYALIIIACVILVLGIAGIIYICISWSRYKAYKDRMQRMYVVPRYDPVYVEPSLKEYETQVLQMNVPVDDYDSYNDLQIDFSNTNHAFNLDNVSNITKDQKSSTGQQSPMSSEAATTARASSIIGNHKDSNIHSLRRSTLGRKNGNASNTNTLNHRETPVLYPLFNHDGDMMNLSPSNDNVIFKEQNDYSHLGFSYLDQSAETTTEL